MSRLNQILAVAMAVATVACGAGELEPIGFAEISCFIAGSSGNLCAARPLGSADAWVIVASEGQINGLISAGEAYPIDGWVDGCAAGQRPDTFLPEHRCLWLTEYATSVCYAGDGSWWTQVDRCVNAGADPAWTSQQCDGMAGDVQDNPWDSIACFDTAGGSCLGIYGEDNMWVWPTCWVNAWPRP